MSIRKYWAKPKKEYKEYCQNLAKFIRMDIKTKIGITLPDTKYTVRTYSKANHQDIEIRFKRNFKTTQTLQDLRELYNKYEREHNDEESGCIRIKIFDNLDGEVYPN